MWLLFVSSFMACTGKLVSAACPQLEMSPPKVVVKFGGSFSANCTSSSDQIEGFGWESPYGPVALTMGVSSLPFKIDRVTAWEINPMCYVNLLNGDQCTGTLPVTVYKMPDSVFLRQSSTQMVEGQNYSIQCDIINVAPAKRLYVTWHRGNKVVTSKPFDESRPSPVNKSYSFNLTASRDDDGAEIWCEPKLLLWSAGQSPPMMRSVSHKMTVLYPPTFTEPANETLEFQLGIKMTLDCTARGNPPPSYSWQFPKFPKPRDKSQNEDLPVLTEPFEFPGVYTCTASNNQATVTKYFTVSEAPRDRTTFGIIVGVCVPLGVLLFIVGAYFVTPNGTFSCNKGGYQPGATATPI